MIQSTCISLYLSLSFVQGYTESGIRRFIIKLSEEYEKSYEEGVLFWMELDLNISLLK